MMRNRTYVLIIVSAFLAIVAVASAAWLLRGGGEAAAQGGLTIALDMDITDGPCTDIDSSASRSEGEEYQVAVCVSGLTRPVTALSLKVLYDDTLNEVPEIYCGGGGGCFDDNPDVNLGSTKWGDGLGEGWDCSLGGADQPTGDHDPASGVDKGAAWLMCFSATGPLTFGDDETSGVVAVISFHALAGGVDHLSLHDTFFIDYDGELLGSCDPSDPVPAICEGAIENKEGSPPPTPTPTPEFAFRGPYALAVNPNTNRIYVANQWDSFVSVVDGETNAIIHEIDLPEVWGDSPNVTIAVNPTTNLVYVANPDERSIAVIDGATETVIANVTVPLEPRLMAVNAATNRVYMSGHDGSGEYSVMVYDGSTNALVASILTDEGVYDLAVDALRNRIYAASYYNLYVIDGETNTVTQTGGTELAPGGWGNLVVNPSANLLFASSTNHSSVWALNGEDLSVQGEFDIGGTVLAMTYNAATGHLLALNSPPYSPTVLEAVDGWSFETLSEVRADWSRDMDVNPVTGRVYVPSESLNRVSAYQDGPERGVVPLASAVGGLAEAPDVDDAGSGSSGSVPVLLVAIGIVSSGLLAMGGHAVKRRRAG